LYEKIRSNALSFIKSNFSWITLNEQLTELIVNSSKKMLV